MLRIEMQERDVEALGERIYDVLESVGMMYQNDTILDALKKTGATVDSATQIAKFPRPMVRKFIDGIRREHSSGSAPQATTFRDPGMPHIETQVAQYLYDYDTHDRRPGRTPDLIEFVKLGNALHGEEASVTACC